MSLKASINLQRPVSESAIFGPSNSAVRRDLRMASGLVLFAYITAHLVNHALGLVSLGAAERGLSFAVAVWRSPPGTVLLYGAAATHFLLALWAVYERRTFWLPPAELLRIVLGFTLPLLLINHFANTRLAHDMFGLSSDYTRIIAGLWATDSQSMQLGLLAPGWIHGCLGLHFAFNRRPLYRQLRFVLFAVAILLPVLSALGFIAMGRELSTDAAAAAAVQDHLGPAHAAERSEIARWHDKLLIGYFGVIGAAFGARGVRNVLERSFAHLISISYPRQTVRVPRGWSVLEASRAFHLPHASMCGGRARCSTCRIRVTSGHDLCPAAGRDEEATLRRIGASPDTRLACQLRPLGDIAVVPLVRTAQPTYRRAAPPLSADREVVVMLCDFVNRDELARDRLPQDVLYLLTLYAEAICKPIRAAGGAFIAVGTDGIGALFGLECEPAPAAQSALRTAGAIERAVAEIDNRLGHEDNLRIAVSVHAGRAVIGEIGPGDPPALMAAGEAMEGAYALRKALAAQGKAFAISEAVSSGRSRHRGRSQDRAAIAGLRAANRGSALRRGSGRTAAKPARRTGRSIAAPVEWMMIGSTRLRAHNWGT
jgi:adenylate cyclase